MDLPAALYLPPDPSYLATPPTAGPWDPGLQHAGPPAALLAREAERVSAIDGGQTVRLAYDILAPVPVGPGRGSAQGVRRGRRIELDGMGAGAPRRTIVGCRSGMGPGGRATGVGGPQ